MQFTDEGYRLVRCAIGDGAVPMAAMLDILAAQGQKLTAVLEPGALEARHVRLSAAGMVELLPAQVGARARRLPRRRAGQSPRRRRRLRARRGSAARMHAIADYELNMIRRSAGNMRAIGLGRLRTWRLMA